MITQENLNNEIELATSIFLYYTEKMMDYLSIGSNKYKLWYKDSLQISYLLSLLKYIWYEDNIVYIGDSEITDDKLLSVFYKIREYWLNDINSDYTYNLDITIPDVQPPYYPYTPVWKAFTIVISEDGTTSVNLSTYGFDEDKIDNNSISVTTNQSLDPINIITEDTEPGCRIEDNTFYWNSGNYYDLNDGDQVYIKYLQISD